MSEQRRQRSVEIVAHSGISGGSPLLREGVGVRLVDIAGRLKAGENPIHVAEDFGVKPASVYMLLTIAEAMEHPEREPQVFPGGEESSWTSKSRFGEAA